MSATAERAARLFGGSSGQAQGSPAHEALAADLAPLIHAAARVVASHERSCRASARIAGRNERLAAERACGRDRAWLWFADPDVLDLREALYAMQQRR